MSKISAVNPNICIIDRIGAHEDADPGPSEPAGAGVHPDRAAVVAAAEGAAVKKPKVRIAAWTFVVSS